jgi:hypothetical protein
MNLAEKRRMARQLANLSELHTGTPELEDVIRDTEAAERERATTRPGDIFPQHIVDGRVDVIVEDMSHDEIDIWSWTCTGCARTGSAESILRAGQLGWQHASECGGRS